MLDGVSSAPRLSSAPVHPLSLDVVVVLIMCHLHEITPHKHHTLEWLKSSHIPHIREITKTIQSMRSPLGFPVVAYVLGTYVTFYQVTTAVNPMHVLAIATTFGVIPHWAPLIIGFLFRVFFRKINHGVNFWGLSVSMTCSGVLSGEQHIHPPYSSHFWRNSGLQISLAAVGHPRAVHRETGSGSS